MTGYKGAPIFRSGVVVLMQLPFTTGAGLKRRPALMLFDTGDADIIVAPITSHVGCSTFDVALAEWQQAGLLLPLIVRVHKLITMEKRLVERRLGALTSNDWALVRVKVQELCASI